MDVWMPSWAFSQPDHTDFNLCAGGEQCSCPVLGNLTTHPPSKEGTEMESPLSVNPHTHMYIHIYSFIVKDMRDLTRITSRVLGYFFEGPRPPYVPSSLLLSHKTISFISAYSQNLPPFTLLWVIFIKDNLIVSPSSLKTWRQSYSHFLGSQHPSASQRFLHRGPKPNEMPNNSIYIYC